jgi:hypothetical protein
MVAQFARYTVSGSSSAGYASLIGAGAALIPDELRGAMSLTDLQRKGWQVINTAIVTSGQEYTIFLLEREIAE